MDRSKDEVIKELQQKRAEKENAQNAVDINAMEVDIAEYNHSTVEEEYARIYKQLQEAAQKMRDAKAELKQAKHVISNYNEDIRLLERELQRILESERIQEQFESELERYFATSENATWRAANRDDGDGAFPHQIEGAAHLAMTGSGILGDERGLGKTLTSLIYCDFVEAQKIVAIVPNPTVDTFIEETHKWAPQRNVVRLAGLSKGERSAQFRFLDMLPQFVLVVNYEAWRRDPDVIKELVDLQVDTMILDEAHNIKETSTVTCKGVTQLCQTPNTCPNCGLKAKDVIAYDSKSNKASCSLCGHYAKAWKFNTIQYIIPMTGSPILNRPQELFPLLRIVAPDEFEKLSEYERDFCKRLGTRWTWQYGGADRLLKRVGPKFLQRTRESAGVTIPKNTKVKYHISFAEVEEKYPEQANAYKQARDYAWLVLDPDKEITISMTVMLTVLLRLRQVITYPAGVELKLKDDEGNVVETTHMSCEESIKLDTAQNLISEIKKENGRMVLFSQFKAPLHELERRLTKEGVRAVILDGSTPAHIKDEIRIDFDKFKSDKYNYKWDIVLCNYKSARVGLNFHAANHAIVLDREWNEEMESQATGRIDRLGQSEETTTHIIEVTDTVDTWMDNLIEQKGKMIKDMTTSELVSEMRSAISKGKI